MNNDVWIERGSLESSECQKLIKIFKFEDKLGNVGKNILAKVHNSNQRTLYTDQQKKDVWYFDIKIGIRYHNVVNDLEKLLRKTFERYIKHFKERVGFDTFQNKLLNSKYMFFPYLIIAKYDENKGHIKNWHPERQLGSYRIYNHPDKDNDSTIITEPAFVMTTYLNTVKRGGHTEFKYRTDSIKPTVGATIIFPTTFPFVHKANIPKGNDKYILTTKVCYDLSGKISSVFNDHNKGWPMLKPTTVTDGGLKDA